MKRIYILIAIAALTSCEKKTTTPVDDKTITVSAKTGGELVNANMRWKSIAEINKQVPDSTFVVMQYDVYNSSNVMQYSIVDTIKMGANQQSGSKVTDKIIGTNTAKNIHVVNTWSKASGYTFKY